MKGRQKDVIYVRMRDAGQYFAYRLPSWKVSGHDWVIVEHDRGTDYGQVAAAGHFCAKEHTRRESLKRLIRKASEQDMKQIEENRRRAKEAFTTCQDQIVRHKLEMKLVRAEYSFDRTKIVFYFTANGRVDFRELVKSLAKIFKARIELRQIGVRDEARLFGGYGCCGRELCCARFLRDFEPVTIKMAKEEGLPLNPPKISGVCGRLMCCLAYEFGTYKSLSKGLPHEGERVQTPQGKGKVISVNVFKRTATVELEDGVQVHIHYK
ncbi:MAG: stage 0 sporulation family protein [Candidatus Omnitrophica bacterium]|nr:stage 0 sporulation family protein [Candidatus Omnitrophota bacterium]